MINIAEKMFTAFFDHIYQDCKSIKKGVYTYLMTIQSLKNWHNEVEPIYIYIYTY